MLPNSRIVPPPSSQQQKHTMVNPAPSECHYQEHYRKRDVPAAALPSYHHHHIHSQQTNSTQRLPPIDLSATAPKQTSKGMLSRLLVTPQSNMTTMNASPAKLPYNEQPYSRPPATTTKSATRSTSSLKTPSTPHIIDSPPSMQPEHQHMSRPRHASMVTKPATDMSTAAAATPNDIVQRKAPPKTGPSKGGAFGRMFRKLGKNNEEDDAMLDDAPRVRSISINSSENNGSSRTSQRHNIPLAPAPPPSAPAAPKRTTSIIPNTALTGIPPDYLVQLPARRNTVSDNRRKPPVLSDKSRSTTTSTSAYSIYRTYGTESSTNVSAHATPENTKAPVIRRSVSTRSPVPTVTVAAPVPTWITSRPVAKADDLAQIVSNNVQRRTQVVRVVTSEIEIPGPAPPPLGPPPPPPSFPTTEGPSDDYDDDDDLHRTFDMSMDAIEEEESRSSLPIDKANNEAVDDGADEEEEEEEEEEDDDDDDDDDDDVFVDATGYSQDDIERESKLSKRLSGGHFGSAGGLVLSTSPKQQKRRSRPPPEDIAQAMLNWKHLSGTTTKRNSSMAWAAVATEMKQQQQKDEDYDESSTEVLRQKAADVLTGEKKSTTDCDQLAPPTSTSYEDVFWKDADTDLFQVQDPRLLMVKPATIPPLEHTSEEAKEYAQRLWEEDDTIVPRERMAEWLGQGKTLNSEALGYYMDNFEFKDMRLDSAFRKLCGKLYLKAEAQQIDRILEVFANRYWTCNPSCILKSQEVVYAVVYSVLLLNTDLHVAQGNYSRMTRQEFIRNTMAAVHDQRSVSEEVERRSPKFCKEWESEVETYLRDLYTSVKQYQILQPLSRRAPTGHGGLEKRGSILGGRRVVGLKRSVGSIIRRSTLAPDEVQPRSSSSSNSRPSSPKQRRDSFSSIGSSTSFGSRAHGSTLQPSYQPIIQLMEAHESALFASRAPYLKEGVVLRKHLLENANQKARHREWRECYLQVKDGELKMYALHTPSDMDRRSVLRSSSTSLINLSEKSSLPTSSSFGGFSNKWGSHSHLLGTVPLNHTLANVLPPPGYNRQRPHVFAIQQADGGVNLFQTTSLDQSSEWIATCNYWAARASKEPLPGGVSNMEYGWGTCLSDVVVRNDTDHIECRGRRDPESIMLFDWKPPAPTLVSSVLDERRQYESLKKYLGILDREINEHRDLKRKILVKFPSKSQNHVKAITNWEAKSKYLLHDIIKYQNYCDVIEKSIQEQDEAYEIDMPPQLDPVDIHLDYNETSVDLIKEIGDELRAARIVIS